MKRTLLSMAVWCGVCFSLQAATPVVHCSFDNTATNSGSGGSAYDAILVGGPVYATGVVGAAAIDLDGVDDYISVPYTLPDQGSIAFWYYAKGPWVNYKSVFDNSVDANDWEMWIAADGNIVGRIDGTSGNVAYDLDNLAGPDHWYHVVYTWDKTGSAELYINGLTRSTDPIDTWVNPGTNFYIGGGNTGNGNTDGRWDDLRIYDTVLTTNEVQELFGEVMAVHLKFDGNGDDSSPGTNNPAELFGNTAYVDGIDGQCLELQQTASQDYAKIDHRLSEQGTIALWHYAAGPFVNYNNVYDNSVAGNQWDMWIDVNGGLGARISGTYGKVVYDLDNLNSSNHWYHIVYTWNKTGDVARLYVNGTERDTDTIDTGWVNPGRYINLGGAQSTHTNRNGRWDDVRIYNRELTASEIESLFGEFEAVYLPFDGDTIDQAGGDNSAILYGDPQYVAGRWNNQALDCDGTDDYAEIDYMLPNRGTIAFWYYAQGPWYNWQSIFDNSIDSNQWEMWINSDGLLECRVVGTSGRPSYDLDNLNGPNHWYHIAYTWEKGGNAKLFVDGIERGSDPIDSWATPGRYLYLGGHAGNTLGNGVWDEVHIYNRVLTASEIATLMEDPRPRGTLITVK